MAYFFSNLIGYDLTIFPSILLYFIFQSISNTYWQIWQNGFAKTSPNARWFFVPYSDGPVNPENPIEPAPGNSEQAAVCTSTGGTVAYAMCGCDAEDFFNTCLGFEEQGSVLCPNTSRFDDHCNANNDEQPGAPNSNGCTSANLGSPRLNCYCKCPSGECFIKDRGCDKCAVENPGR